LFKWFTWDPTGGILRIQEEAEMADATAIEEQVEAQPEAQWDLAECTCPDWCERDHELD
jgi:hypothetical protein